MQSAKVAQLGSISSGFAHPVLSEPDACILVLLSIRANNCDDMPFVHKPPLADIEQEGLGFLLIS